MINQGSSEVSMMFGVKEAQEKKLFRHFMRNFCKRLCIIKGSTAGLEAVLFY
ncbi:hypothetical protein MGI18_15710 [Bacillus sp. OVS6]|nr:hypothetical protein MGI18_15710 [Bacillus sp. OVS6]